MKITIKTKNLESTEVLENFIEERLGALKKFVNAEIFVEVERESNHHKKGEIFNAKAQIRLPGKKVMMAQASAESLSKAVVEVRNELKKEIERYKVKSVKVARRQQRKNKREI